MNCIPDSTGTICANCGWKRPGGTIGWNRTCPASPELQAACDRLGLTVDACLYFRQQLGIWTTYGFNERTSDQKKKITATCNGCGYRAKTCLSPGCGSHRRPPLDVMQRVPQFDCPEGFWNDPETPGEIARRRAICLACQDWDAKLSGCKLIDERERERLTKYKLRHGHCARCCSGLTMKW